MLAAGTAGRNIARCLANGSAAPSWSGSANISGVGTLTAGTWNATTIASGWGGTGANLSAGPQGGLPYFSGIGVMGALGAGIGGYILQSGGAGAPSWLAPTSFLAGTATNIAGGAMGAVPYQTAANITAILPAGTAGQVLQSNGNAPPSLGVGLRNGRQYSPAGRWELIPYQTAVNTTAMLADGTAGQILLSNGVAAPAWGSNIAGALTFSGGYGSVAGAAGNLHDRLPAREPHPTPSL